MDLLGRLQPLIIIGAALIGSSLGAATPLGNISPDLIEIFLMLLLYILFLCVDPKQIRQSLKNVRYTATAVSINFIFTPLLAYMLGEIFFADLIDMRIGLLMLLVTPCTDWYLVFTGMSNGNVELNMSILPLNLLLQIVLLPIYLLVFMNSDVTMDVSALLGSVVRVLAFPFLASYITRASAGKNKKFQCFLEKQSDALQLFFLCLAVIVMFASQGNELLEDPILVVKMFIPLICFFVVVFFLSQFIGRIQKFSKKDIVALNFTTLARNSPLSLAIAVATFPDRPLISLTLVIGPLIELPVLSLISGILKKWNS